MTNHAEIEKITAAEIEAQKRTFSARRAEITETLAALFKDKGFSPGYVAVSERSELVIGKARQLLNGSAHALMEDLQPANREEALRLELDAIDHILRILNQKHIERLAVETQIWANEHEAEIRALLRDIFLTVCKLRGLRAKSDELNRKIAGARVPFGDYFGEWDSWDGGLLRWNPDQFETAIREAVAAGVASESEIRKAMR